MKTVSLFVNRKRDIGGKITGEVIKHLKKDAFDILMLADEENKRFAECVTLVSNGSFYKESECIITLGGDGTILNVAPDAAMNNVPILGINSGTVGFMAELDKSNFALLSRLKNGEYSFSERMMLEAEVENKGKLLALNECVIADEGGMKLLGMNVYENSDFFANIRADGLIFSSPTGSTGYSYAAGGGIIDPKIECIAIQSICSYHIKNARQMIFSPDNIFTVKDIISDESNAIVSADGRQKISLSGEDTVRIYKSKYKTKLISFSDKSFYNVFFDKL